MYRILPVPFIALIFGLPLAVAALPAVLWPHPAVILAALALAPFTYTLSFVLVAGGLSVPFHKAIIPGKFPRDLKHPIYGRRRMYGLCWTSVYYFKPLYWICLSMPFLKRLLFRLFGYRGSMNFTVYPDTWIRDLPLLDFEDGVYVSNRATLGTNIALSNGKILVDGITLRRGSMVGHLTMLAPGVTLEEQSEVAVGCAIGIRVQVGRGALVQPTCALNHHTHVGAGAEVGSMSYVGLNASIADGVRIPAGSLVPARAQVRGAADAQRFVSSATRMGGRVGLLAAPLVALDN